MPSTAREHLGPSQVTREIRDPVARAIFNRIEKARLEKKFPVAELCRVARVKERTFFRIRGSRQNPQRETLQRLERAVRDAVTRSEPSARLITGLYHSALCLIAIEQGIPRETLDAVDLSVQRPENPEWLAVSRARAMAIYIVAIEHEVPASVLAGVAGISKQKVGSALARVEDWRDDPAIDAMLERVRAVVAPELRA